MEFIPSRARNPYELPCCLAIAHNFGWRSPKVTDVFNPPCGGGSIALCLFLWRSESRFAAPVWLLTESAVGCLCSSCCLLPMACGLKLYNLP